jgi:16S rRNA processing protein RimM
MTSDLICIGSIAGSYGVQGEVRLKSFCAEPADIASYGPLTTEDGTRSFTVHLTRPVTGGYSARLSGVGTKEQADALRGTALCVDRSKMPSLPDDEFYHADLIGLAVYDTGGAVVGRVTAVHNHGAGDLLDVQPESGKSALLLPFTRAIVPTVDLKARRVIVDVPEGLD